MISKSVFLKAGVGAALGPCASKSPGKLVEMQVLGPHFRPGRSEAYQAGQMTHDFSKLWATKLEQTADRGSIWRTTLCFSNRPHARIEIRRNDDGRDSRARGQWPQQERETKSLGVQHAVLCSIDCLKNSSWSYRFLFICQTPRKVT